MTRQIPIALQDSFESGVTTHTLLMKITPVTDGFPPYGVTLLNRDIEYLGLTYSAAIGLQPSTVMASADLSVDNAETESLVPEFDVPISESDIRAGVYDYAEFVMYLIDYENIAAGHVILQEGTLGRITIDNNGLSFVNELRGLSAELKQSVCAKDSLSCRAIFGSQPIGSSTPGPQVARDYCGFDVTSLNETSSVTSVGLENTLTFTITFPVGGSFTYAEDDLMFGSVTFNTGLNAGRTCEIETNTAGGQITLGFPAMFPIQVGDQVTYRPGCNLKARDNSRGCKHWFGAQWVLHFRGEPDIPIGDSGQIETPGASAGPGTGGMNVEQFEQQ